MDPERRVSSREGRNRDEKAVSPGKLPKHPYIAKIACPKITGSTPRPRLFRLLDLCGEKPVTWLSAPAGSGKTTLVAGHLDARGLPCIWYNSDEGDADLATFFYYMGLAAKKASPRRKAPLPLLTPEYLAGIPAFTRRFFEQLYGRLLSQCQNPANPASRTKDVIVFDNYQDVPPDSPFHDMIATGQGDRVINALAVSADGATVYCGTASGTVFSYAITAPTAVTNAASGVGAIGATLNGTVNANGADTTVTFEYGTDTSYGGSIAASPSPVTGRTTDTAVSAGLTLLNPNTIYHFRVKAVSSSGTTYGLDQSFTTTKATPTTVLAVNSASSFTSTYGDSVTFTATVTGVIVAPTGTVNFQDNGTSISGCSARSVSGATTVVTATCTTSTLAAGTHNLITAVYNGDGSFYASTSAAISGTVNQASSTTGLGSSPNPSTYGQSVTFTATVTSSAGTPTGSVTFKDGAATLGTGSLNGSGQATFSTSSLGVGPHSSITAVYSGDANFSTSTSSALSQTVNQASSTTGLNSSSNPSSLGQSVTFTATVTSGDTGTVNFKDGANSITGCAAATISGTTATCATSALGTGSHSITAVYSGDTNYTGSSSTALIQMVNLAPTITSASNATFIIGTAGTFTVTAGGYPAPTLSETGTLPSGVTFTPATGVLSGTPAIGTHGTYNITFTAHNTSGTDATQNFTLTVDFNPGDPTLIVSTLANGSVATAVVLNISGTATSPNGIQSLTVNGMSVALGTGGAFSFPFKLVQGANLITTVATDNAGKQITDSRTITLTPSALVVTITSPTDGTTTSQANVTVTGTAPAGSTVVVSVNSVIQPAILTGTDFTATVALPMGLNTIQATATGQGGTGDAKVTVIGELGGIDLAITAPDHDLITSDQALILSGTVSGGTQPVTVSITLNGQTFTPAVVSGAFTQQLTLAAEQTNAIVVTATDSASHTAIAQRNVIHTLTASGDINGDGKVDITDALLALEASVHLITPTADELTRGDVAPMVNGVSEPDGRIDIEDAILILRKAVGLGW